MLQCSGHAIRIASCAAHMELKPKRMEIGKNVQSSSVPLDSSPLATHDLKLPESVACKLMVHRTTSMMGDLESERRTPPHPSPHSSPIPAALRRQKPAKTRFAGAPG